MGNTRIEIVSVSGGNFHRPVSASFNSDGSVFRNARLMRCGRSLVPLNVFETVVDADKYTGGRLERYVCQQCEKKAIPSTCGFQAFGMMPPCTLDPGHEGDHEDGFGGHYGRTEGKELVQVEGSKELRYV